MQLTILIAYITPVLAPILTFAVFSVLARNSGGRATLDTARVFTSLSLFALLTEPLGSLIMSLATLMGAVGCFDRIQAFLNMDVRVESRTIPMDVSLNGSSQSFEKGSSTQGSDIEVKKIGLTVRGEKDYYPISTADAIVVENGSFGWDKEKEPLLQSISLKVPREKLTMLVGPVGCGKSTLLKALLGEVPSMKGTIQVSASRISYCDQTPWHMNGTVQESIIAVAEFDGQWYTSVINACALDEDLRQLPRGDQTVIGSSGIALSGGQSQRIVST